MIMYLIIIFAVLFCLFLLKYFLILCIRCYQKIAPKEIRGRCLYEPTCSEYMILAIKKYGVIKGILKGIDRLKRCHYPNGGVDYP